MSHHEIILKKTKADSKTNDSQDAFDNASRQHLLALVNLAPKGVAVPLTGSVGALYERKRIKG